MTALRTPRVIKVGTDFSGLDTAVLALQRLSHLPVQLCFCSDTDKHCKKLLLHFHQPKNFYDNAEGRKKEEEVPVDLYIATPPCQPWSSQGKQLGLQDPRGQLIKVPIRYVQRHRPRLFIMENVKGMCSKKRRPVLRGVRSALQTLGYHVFVGVLNARFYFVPQDRWRLFVVAIRQDSYRHKFQWPRKRGKRTLSSALDPATPADKPGRLPKNPRSRALALDAYKKSYSKGIDPRKVPVAIDIGCSASYANFGIDISRTLCQGRARSGGFWISSRGRTLSTTEMLKVSGISPSTELQGWDKLVSKSQLQGMLGNCVPVPLVGEVLQKAMFSAGLASKLVDFPVMDQ